MPGFFFWLRLTTGFYWVLPWVFFDGFLPDGTGFYLVLLSFVASLTGFDWVVLGLNGFLLGFTGFYWVLQVLMGFYRI